MYGKIAKWTAWALMIISVLLVVWGSMKGFDANGGAAVDVLLRWGYILLIAAIALVVILGVVLGGINDPKSLVRLGIGFVILAAVALIAYLTASGAQPLGYLGEAKPESTLKLTDTLLNLTYFLGAGAIIAIIAGEIISAIRNK